MNKNTSVTIKLDFPVKLADRELKEITMRRPKMKDMVKHKINSADVDIETGVSFTADLCGLNVEDMGEFDTVDFQKTQEEILRFRGLLK